MDYFTFGIDIIITFAIYGIIALSTNLDMGYGGIPNLAKLLFVAGGAFFVGGISTRILKWLSGIGGSFIQDNIMVISELGKMMNNTGIGLTYFFGSIIGAMLFCALLGGVIALTARKLSRDYLAISSIAFAEALPIIGYNWKPFVGGYVGVGIPNPFSWSENSYIALAIVSLGLLLGVYLFIRRITNSPFGRKLRAIRDDPVLASSLGYDIKKTKTKTIMLAAMIGAIAGVLYVFNTCGLVANAYTVKKWTFFPVAMMILGGSGNNYGTLAGVGIFVFIRKIIFMYSSIIALYIPFSVGYFDSIVFGMFIVLLILYRPQGLFPEKPISTVSIKETKNKIMGGE